MNPILKEEVARSYGVACERVHRLTARFYEDLFTRDGNPHRNPAHVIELTQKFRQQVNYELDLVREASNQYFESNDQQKPQGLFGGHGEGS